MSFLAKLKESLVLDAFSLVDVGVYLGHVLFRGFVFLVPAEEELQALDPGRHLELVALLLEDFVGQRGTYYVIFGLAD